MKKKEDFPYDQTHIAIPLEKAIGKEVVCEDGVIRLVETIVHCAGSFQYAVINEDIETGKSGSLIHLLRLFCFLREIAPPTEDDVRKFDEIAKSFTYEYVGHKDEGLFKKPKKPESAKPTFQTKGWKN